MAKNGRAKNKKKDLQSRVRGKEMLEKFMRHLGTLEISLDDEELELQSTFPDDSHPFANGNYEMTRTLDLEEHAELRAAVRRVVELCHDAVFADDADYDPNRCDRCVKSDCCWIERIHLTEPERVAILDHLGLADTPKNNARFFEPDDDLAGYYQHMMRHQGGHCSFLHEVGGMMRCSIYEVRPQVCRDYDAGYCTEYSKLLPKRKPVSV